MPRLAFASALAVGVESLAEYLDFEATRDLVPEATTRSTNACLPEGLQLESIAEVSPGAETLGELVNAARYAVRLEGGLWGDTLESDLAARLAGAAELKVSRERKGRTEELDVLPSIHHLAV